MKSVHYRVRRFFIIFSLEFQFGGYSIALGQGISKLFFFSEMIFPCSFRLYCLGSSVVKLKKSNIVALKNIKYYVLNWQAKNRAFFYIYIFNISHPFLLHVLILKNTYLLKGIPNFKVEINGKGSYEKRNKNYFDGGGEHGIVCNK